MDGGELQPHEVVPLLTSDDAALRDAADWIVGRAREGRPVWAYFNNDLEAHAIHDAQTLRAMVRQAGPGSAAAAKR